VRDDLTIAVEVDSRSSALCSSSSHGLMAIDSSEQVDVQSPSAITNGRSDPQ